MNRKYFTIITFALTAMTAGNVLAADAETPKTRDQVLAELIEAQRTGDIIGNYETGAKLKEMFPGGYPK
ncbi:MAG: hypothetical protein FD135_4570 [Comamonadaceae bacterium]|nr:MAG: hypothetical protein FD135_4570 [Comamonadaceae bacterium]